MCSWSWTKKDTRKTRFDVQAKASQACEPVHDSCDSQCRPEQAEDEMSTAQVKLNSIRESMDAGNGTDASSSKLMELQLEEANGR